MERTRRFAGSAISGQKFDPGSTWPLSHPPTHPASSRHGCWERTFAHPGGPLGWKARPQSRGRGEASPSTARLRGWKAQRTPCRSRLPRGHRHTLLLGFPGRLGPLPATNRPQVTLSGRLTRVWARAARWGQRARQALWRGEVPHPPLDFRCGRLGGRTAEAGPGLSVLRDCLCSHRQRGGTPGVTGTAFSLWSFRIFTNGGFCFSTSDLPSTGILLPFRSKPKSQPLSLILRARQVSHGHVAALSSAGCCLQCHLTCRASIPCPGTRPARPLTAQRGTLKDPVTLVKRAAGALESWASRQAHINSVAEQRSCESGLVDA